MNNQDDEIRYDKLGRRIPVFDRSKAGKKAAQTAKKKYGEDFHSQNMSKWGSQKNPNKGYGSLAKDDPEAHKKLSREAIRKRWQHKS